ncbi:MAG: PBP1A family penicillin-binding protein [Rickettsiales bacterium]|jgi:penicillin-binding protein 1A|nr:PBP1A family penicillin-binding protein [Rickettsiales bacterium]
MLKKIVHISFYLFIAGIITFSVAILYFTKQLPNHKNLKQYEPDLSTRLYSNDGKFLKEYSKEKRIFMPIEQIPPLIKNAFISAEDASFYENSGISLKSIANAAFQSAMAIFRNEGRVRGASTITQQVAKNFLLSSERTITRKIKEILIAIRLTQEFEKDKILELYLNQIFFGNHSYGIATAALNYFNKSLDEISISEAALLASLPKAPSQLDPTKGTDGVVERRNWVIERLFENHYITETEMEKAKVDPIILKKKDIKYVANGEFFSEETRKQLAKLYGENGVERDGNIVETTINPELQALADKYLKQGIEEYDLRHGFRGAISNLSGEIDFDNRWGDLINDFKIEQKFKNEWQKAIVLNIDDEQGSILIGLKKVDNVEGQNLENDVFVKLSKDDKLLIMGYIPLENTLWAKKYIDVNKIGPDIKQITDLGLKRGDVIVVEKVALANEYALRQIPNINGGLLAMNPYNGNVVAMMGGYIDSNMDFNRTTQAERQPGSTMKPFTYLAALENGFTPASIIIDEEIELSQGDDKPAYKPKNNEGEGMYYGPTTLRVGLEKSRNVTTVRLASEVGLGKIVSIIKKFGISDKPRFDFSLVLGSTESTLLKMVKAYGMIANGGKRITQNFIEKIQDRNGKIIYKADTRECKNCLVDVKLPFNEIIVPELDDDKEEITDDASAYQLTNMLVGVVRRGTAWRAKAISNAPIAAKTGTTNDGKDAWFVGYSPDLVVGVYLGFDKPEALGANEFGSNVAGPIFTNFMKDALQYYHSNIFKVPETIKLLQIDATTGYYPTPQSKDTDIVTEAFKLNDNPKKLEEDSTDKMLDELEEMNMENEMMKTPEIIINDGAKKSRISDDEVLEIDNDEDFDIIFGEE